MSVGKMLDQIWCFGPPGLHGFKSSFTNSLFVSPTVSDLNKSTAYFDLCVCFVNKLLVSETGIWNPCSVGSRSACRPESKQLLGMLTQMPGGSDCRAWNSTHIHTSITTTGSESGRLIGRTHIHKVSVLIKGCIVSFWQAGYCATLLLSVYRARLPAGQRDPDSEAEDGRGASRLVSTQLWDSLEACWLGGRLEASQLGSSSCWEQGCGQIVKSIQAINFLTKANTSLGASRGAALMPCLKQFLLKCRRQIIQCVLTDLKDISA